jgi:general transcription factor 3C polypeptide 5 (transcription factor C subunit 1)
MNQFSVPEAREILNSKILLSLVSYIFSDGPWRDTLVAFGYDPRKHPESRIYQRMYFRNQNHPIERVSVMSRRQDRTTENAQIRAANQWNMENDAERK